MEEHTVYYFGSPDFVRRASMIYRRRKDKK